MRPQTSRGFRQQFLSVCLMITFSCALTTRGLGQEQRHVPDHVPPKRSSQIQGWLRHQLRSAARSLSALEPLVVDAHVRRGIEMDPHRPVRKQLRLHQLGLDRTEARRHGCRAPDLDDYVDSLVDNGVNSPGPVDVRQLDVHLAVRQAARRQHAGTRHHFTMMTAASIPFSGRRLRRSRSLHSTSTCAGW